MAKFFSFFKYIPQIRYYSVLMAILSGVMVGTSYIPFNGWALFFCYVPLWFASTKLILSKSSYLKIFFIGWVSQFVLTLIGFNWIYYTASEFGHLHWALCLGALLLFSSLMHIYIPLSVVLVAWLSRRFKILSALHLFILLALSLALFERAWPSIFEWNLGYVLLWMKWPMFQWADTIGFWGLSTLILILQAVLAYALWMIPIRKRRSLISLFGLLLTIAALNLVGQYKQEKWRKADSVVHFALAQGNVGNAEKLQSEQGSQYHPFILKLYTDLMAEIYQKKPQTEIMMWPETALPFALDSDFHSGRVQKSLMDTVQANGNPLMTGAYSVDQSRRDHLGYPIVRNSFFYISPDGNLAAPNYNKTNLLVFGEYLPFGEQFPWLYKLFPFVGTYEKGPGPTVQTVDLKNKKLAVGPQICYESLDPGFSRALAKKGAQVIVNVTNDSWYGPWAEPYQHMIMTLARGVETRRPLVRSTNTGISTAILASGEVLEQSPIDQKWAHTFEISYREKAPQSFYTLVGHFDWLLWLTIFILYTYVGATTPPDLAKVKVAVTGDTDYNANDTSKRES